MSSPFVRAGEFKPTTGEKNARDQVIEYAERHGWLLDLKAERNRLWQSQWEQDPNRFVRTAHPELGGHWCLELDYEVKGDPDDYRPTRSWDNTLRAVRIWHSSDVTDLNVVLARQELRNYHQSNSARSVLWDLTDREDGKFVPLRKRTEALLREPDLAMWLVQETHHSAIERARRRDEEYAEQHRRRRRPIPITWPKGQWMETTNRLRRVAGDLSGADGLTDVHALVKDARELIDLISAGLVEKEETCFYCGESINEDEREIDPGNQRTYGPCCKEHARRFDKKRTR